jgi:hypothetical protein
MKLNFNELIQLCIINSFDLEIDFKTSENYIKASITLKQNDCLVSDIDTMNLYINTIKLFENVEIEAYATEKSILYYITEYF